MKKFNENLNTAVITTKYILEDDRPILYVFHYEEDGAWQFSGDEQDIKDADYRITSLQEMINIDISISEIADLPLGKMAYRRSSKDSWAISQIE